MRLELKFQTKKQLFQLLPGVPDTVLLPCEGQRLGRLTACKPRVNLGFWQPPICICIICIYDVCMMEKIHLHISPKPIHSPPTSCRTGSWPSAPYWRQGTEWPVVFGSKSPPGKSQGELIWRSIRNGTNQLVHPLLHLSRHSRWTAAIFGSTKHGGKKQQLATGKNKTWMLSFSLAALALHRLPYWQT